MDILNLKFNRWTVIAFSHKSGKKQFFSCLCECGTEGVVRKDQLTRGISKSCGCWKREVSKEQIIRLSTTHGLANKSKSYSIWKHITQRCLNKNNPSYKNYGGRGITICERWKDYANFFADMGDCPEGMSIDRIDNNGNYEPSNCRWADKKTQANNTRTNIFIKHDGETLTIKQWSEKLSIPYLTLYQRIFKLSWPIKRAFTAPIQFHHKIS